MSDKCKKSCKCKKSQCKCDELVVNGDAIIRGNLITNGGGSFGGNLTSNGTISSKGTISAPSVCLKVQDSPPACSPDKDCLWVAVDGLHLQDSQCKDNIVLTKPTNPFHGWWSTVTKGDMFAYDPTFQAYVQDDIDAYIFIDTTVSPIKITTTAGTNKQPRVPTPLDINPVDPSLFTYNQVDDTTLLAVNNPLGQTGSDFNQFPDSFALKLQSDGNTIISTSDSNPAGYQQVTTCKLVRVQEPKLRPYDDTSVNFPEGSPHNGGINDPVFLTRYIFDQLLHMGSGQCSTYIYPPNLITPATCVIAGLPIPQPVDCDFVGFREAYAILNRLLSDGITFASSIKKVRVTANNSGVTDIYTDVFSYATAGSTVIIDGFTGVYSILNGTYVNGVAGYQFGGLPNPSSLHVDFLADASGKQIAGTFPFHFLLQADTSSLPHDNLGIAQFTGNPTVTVRHHVTSDSTYAEFVAAVHAMFFLIWKTGLHDGFRVFFPSDSIFVYNTWEQLQLDVKLGNAIGQNLQTRSSTMRPSLFYHNVTLAGLTAPPAVETFLFNDPFGLVPNFQGNFSWPAIYNYDIDLRNYLEDAANLYWALEGVPSGPWIEVQQNIQNNFGYKPNLDPTIQGGKTFAGLVVPYDQNPDLTYWTIVGGNAFGPTPATASQRNNFYFGRIKRDLVNGHNIGYIRLRTMPSTDPFLLCNTGFFDPTDGTSPKSNREALSKILAVAFRYLVTDLQSEAIIIDNRGNGGGSGEFAITLSEFFGADRSGFIFNAAYKDDGVQQLDQLQDISKYHTINEVLRITSSQYETLFASYNNTQYPGAVFQNGKVIILDDMIAGSAGDVFPNLFLGNNLDKNLGANSQAKFIGDIDGRNKGFASARNPMPVSQNSSFLTDEDSEPVSPINTRYDASYGIRPWRINGTNYFINQQTFVTAIDPAPLKGTAGGNPLPNDWEHVLWPDLGFITPYPYQQLPNEPTPDPTVQTSWNDLWLRQAIFVVLQ